MVALDLIMHLRVDPACCSLVTLESADAASVDLLECQGRNELILGRFNTLGLVDEVSLLSQIVEPKSFPPVFRSDEFLLTHHELLAFYVQALIFESFEELKVVWDGIFGGLHLVDFSLMGRHKICKLSLMVRLKIFKHFVMFCLGFIPFSHKFLSHLIDNRLVSFIQVHMIHLWSDTGDTGLLLGRVRLVQSWVGGMQLLSGINLLLGGIVHKILLITFVNQRGSKVLIFLDLLVGRLGTLGFFIQVHFGVGSV